LTWSLAASAAVMPAQGADHEPLPSPIQSITAMAWLGGWESLRAPAVAAPAADGETEGDLEQAFHVAWRRDGHALRVRITKLGDAWVGRLAVELRLAADTRALTYGYGDLPVRVPLADARKGQVLWAWEYGVPSWFLGEGEQGAAGAVFDTTNSHGFFVDRGADRAFVVHIAVDWPQTVGESVEVAFRLAPGAKPDALQAERRKRLGIERAPPLHEARLRRLRAAGFVRVDPTGWGFVTAGGRPLRLLGQNTPHLVTLSPAEQEKLLARSEAAGITVTRLLIPDYAYRPRGAWNEEAYRRLPATVDRCAAHGIRTIICLEYSGAGMQYNLTIHRTANWCDLYLMPEMLEWYRGTVARVVVPLRDDPAVLGYDVTNEPDVALSPATPTLTGAWRAWLQTRYGTVGRLREAWGQPDLAGFDAAEIPKQEDYDRQRTQQASDFLAFGGDAIGRSLIARARLVRAADPHHLITVSGWDPRLLRGLPGAGLFDYWAPHSYEIYFVGPEISDQVLYQVAMLRRALPERPRPVVIEEFGLLEDPQFPEPMRAEHCRQFLEAGDRWGAGMMIWYDLTPRLLAEFRAASHREPVPRTEGPGLAFYVAPSEECRVLIYPMYMWRRKWGLALALAEGAGFRVREVRGPAEAAGCQALLVLGDDLAPAEEQAVRAIGLPVVLTPGAEAAKQRLAEAVLLPADAAGQVAMWQERLAGAAGPLSAEGGSTRAAGHAVAADDPAGRQ